MKKFLTQFYLVLSILFITGANSGAFASTEGASVNNTTGNKVRIDFQVENFAKFISYSPFHFEKQNDTVLSLETENEEETHEFILHKHLGQKKLSKVDYSHLSIYFNLNEEIATDTFAEFCPWGDHFHSLSSHQYLLYKVFRI